jgi:hypothetical protein
MTIVPALLINVINESHQISEGSPWKDLIYDRVRLLIIVQLTIAATKKPALSYRFIYALF